MRRPLITFLAGLLMLVLTTTTASAATLQIDDPDDDGYKGARLDITSMTVRNNDFAIVMTVRFRKVTTGDMAIYLRAVGATRRTMVGVGVVSEHRARKDTNYLLTADGEQACRGLKVTWDAEQDIAKVRLPSRCFNGGDYGRVRVRVITEIGPDADLAPSTPQGGWPWSAPVARG